MPDPSDSTHPESHTADSDELDSLLVAYRAKRDITEDPKAQREAQKIAGKLDVHYWKRVEEIIREASLRSNDRLALTDDERLVLDVGLLDESLVAGADSTLRNNLLAELNTPGAPNHFYFSEWLDDRFRRFQLDTQMSAESTKDNTDLSDEVSKLTGARVKLSGALRPFLKGLPGVNEQMQHHILTGRLDDQIQSLGLALLGKRERPAMMARHRLQTLRRQIITKMQPRMTGEAARLPEALNTLYGKLWRERLKHMKKELAKANNPAATSELLLNPLKERVQEHLSSEAKFVKSLLPLGALAGGVARCCSVFLEDGERITKPMLRAELSRIRQSDQAFTVEPVVVIAPFRGRGFFEFDRDSLFVPLFPVQGPSDAIAHAAGNYRMLIDSFQHEAKLKSDYESAFPDAKMARDFQKDYRAWIATAGHGHAEGMEADRKAFFIKTIGPDLSGVLAPANLRYMSEQGRSMLRTRLEKLVASKDADANIHYRLGVLYWQDGDEGKALAQFLHSIALDKKNAMTIFSAGLLLQHKNDMAQAAKLFALCRTVAPDSIWALYAAMAQQGELA